MSEPKHPRSLASLALRALLAWLIVAVGGCARDGRFELLSIDAIDTPRIDAGRTIELTGSGFPVGREVEVMLRGVLHAPLGARRHVAHTLTGRTITPERLELTIGDADADALGGRGTFEGSIEVVVHGASLDGLEARVVGTLDHVVIDIVPSERAIRGATSARRATEGLALAPLLGLRLEGELDEEVDGEVALDDEEALDDAPSEAPRTAEGPGVRIERLDPSGAAARLDLAALGLAPEARIVAIDGMNVLDVDELRVDARASRTTLTLAGPDGRARVIAIDLDAARGRRADRATRTDQLALVVVIAALLFGAWPWPRRDVQTAIAASPDPKAHTAVLTALVSLGLALFVSTLAWGSAIGIPVWLAAGLFVRTSVALATRSAPSSRATLAQSALVRVWLALRALVSHERWLTLTSAVAATVAIGVFLTARGAAESASLPVLGGPLASAPWMPMSWALVRAPFGPFALGAILAAASATPTRIARPSTRTERALRGLDDLGLAILASVFVRVTIGDAASTELATRATALVATSLLFLGLLRARSATFSRAGATFAAVVASGLTIAVAIAWIELGPSGTDATGEQAVAEVVLVAVGLLVVRVASLRGEPEGRRTGGIAPPGLRQSASQHANSPTIVR
ncbi:MAG: hypothetical protein K1X94_09790 [Sandaracinaceae bacterium]|nr:hypothetical protein [Sandaracinaceae bacterium]